MKKIGLFFLILIFTLTKNYGQNFKGGLILGLSTSQVSGDNLSGFNKAGIILGGFTNKKINKQLSIQFEINYIQKGSRNPDMKSTIIENTNSLPHISLHYIEVPLLIKYQQNSSLEYETGIQWAQLINGYYSNLYGKIENSTNPFINNDFGVLLGLNYKLKESVILNTRLSSSILPIGIEDYNVETYNANKKGKYNSTLCFTIYYYI